MNEQSGEFEQQAMIEYDSLEKLETIREVHTPVADELCSLYLNMRLMSPESDHISVTK